MVQQGNSMLIIDNRNGRNEQFLPLFNAMNNAGYGKLLDKRYYIIGSGMNVRQDSETNIIFAYIQQNAILKGFNYVIYYLHEKV